MRGIVEVKKGEVLREYPAKRTFNDKNGEFFDFLIKDMSIKI